MKKRSKFLISVLVIFVTICTAVAIYTSLEKVSYYAMGGIVTVIDKNSTDSSYNITIEQGGVGGQYILECTKEQYDSVCIGEKISCERYQSEMTHKGSVHRISPVSETVSSDQ